MKKLCVFFTLLLVFCAGCSYADVYATTDMTWAEFYAGETGETADELTDAGLDAITTPTVSGLSRFPLVLGVSNDNGTTIRGLRAVQVRMTDDVYNALTDKTRFTRSDSTFTEYKPVNSDGSFGAMVTETTTAADAVATIASGTSARWGHYVISVSSADITIGSANRYCDYYLGALIETSDGKIYGLRHDNNIWSNTDIAFCVSDDYVEPHGTGVKRSYKYTVGLEGQTITKITYMLKDRPDVVINTNLKVKKQTTSSIKPEIESLKTASSVRVRFDLSNAEGYTLSGVATGSGRNSRAVEGYTYSGGILTLTNPAAGNYTATFTNNEYVDISARFTLSDYYATTDMTWAEFYAGETGKTASALTSAGLDAITSPTARIANNFTQLTSESNDLGGRSITGVKAVQVKMTGAVYDSITDKSRYTFSDSAFTEYKEVNSDGSFGAMVSTTALQDDAKVTLSSGAGSTWGNYTLSLSSIDITVKSGDDWLFLGALLETSDGTVYGLRHNNELWVNAGTVALSVQEFVEAHGVSRSYKYTSDLQGKTVKKITFMLKDNPDAVISCDVYLPRLSEASVAAADAILPGSNVPIKFTFSNIPSGANYQLSAVYRGSGRGRTLLSDYTYSGDTLTIAGDIAGAEVYRVIFSDASGQYADIGANIQVVSLFATTDMTWAEFYAGETSTASSALASAGLDAITTPTTNALGRFPLVLGVSNDNGTTISGLKAVQVRLTPEAYSSISDKSRFTFSDTEFTEYKPVNADGSFGAMVTEKVNASNATVTLASGASSTWGHYTLTISGASIDIGLSGDKIARNYLGAYLETKSGKVYGLRHDNNIWSDANTIAFCISGDYVEPHGRGVQRSWRYTSDLAGETITKITYMLKDLPDVVIACEVYVPLRSTATASIAANVQPAAGTGVSIPFTFNGLPSGVTYNLVSLYSGSGRNRTFITDYTYSNNTLTVNSELVSGNYTAIFRAEGYTDISVSFRVEGYHYALTNMTWAEFYAGELGTTPSDLLSHGLDAVSSPTSRVAGRFTQLTSRDNALGGADITGVKDVQVRMAEDVYMLLSSDSRYTFTDEVFAEYKDVDESGAFGEMFTEYEDADNAVVTLNSGATATWGNYVLNISGVNVSLGSGDTRDYLGVLITTSDGQVYGMRHNSNLWFSAGDIALTYEAFTEPHGVTRDYAYTSNLEGKTVTKIQYMLKNKPDVLVSCNVYLKLKSPASVTPVYPAGYHGILVGSGEGVTMRFTGLPSGVTYGLYSVAPNVRRAAALDASSYEYSNGVLTPGDVSAGEYKATFRTERYSDITATFETFTTDATDLIVSSDKNAAALFFLLTPKGYVDAVDAVLNANKFANASDYTTLADNSTADYTSGANIIPYSGFTFDVVLNNVSADYKGIVGFSKVFFMSQASLGTETYNKVYTVFNSLPKVVADWRIPSASDLARAGLRVVLVQANGVSRDISSLTAGGLIIADDGSIMLNYGAMAADCNAGEITEGRYQLSDEEAGEILFSDGVRDGHIRVTMYIEKITEDSGNDTPSDNPSDNPSTPDNPEPSEPGLDLSNSEVVSNIRRTLGQSTNTEVSSLPAGASGKARTVEDLSSTERAAISESEDIAAVLPEVSVTRSAVYVWGVELDSVAENAPIFLHLIVDGVSATDFESSEADESYMFLDDDGSEINTVPANHHVNVAAYLESGKTYSGVITTTSTSDPGSAGGGCSSGFTVLYIAVLGALMKKRYAK